MTLSLSLAEKASYQITKREFYMSCAKLKERFIASPLNYVGGKYRLLTQLFPLFPKDINIALDLFCGGANVGINMSAREIILNDSLS